MLLMQRIVAPRFATILWGLFFISHTRVEGQQADPQPLDSGLSIQRFASEPDLVTPTGIDVAPDGRVFVIECHTHFRPEDYEGPETDRIRVFRDADGDGLAEEVVTFFEGTKATMNLKLAPDGSLLVATRSEVFRLRDTDGDGEADQRQELAHLETKGDYPHNGLSGFAFDLLGRIYFGFGENLGEAYDLVAANGDRLSGGGEGGSIFRINADGTGLVRWARGFWNPFHLAVDDFGRLFAVDNDPDWRPPCRLLHIVKGGDYGYRFSFGRRGTHPFTAWFGGVPDRLGMVSGTGEAPSGLIAYRSSQLPGSYAGDLICTSWGLHTLERYHLRSLGATWTSEPVIIVKGGEDFRPVGIAAGPDGSLFVSDWVKRSYPLHGHGRIWNLRGEGSIPLMSDQTWSIAMNSADRLQVRGAIRELLTGNIDVRGQLAEVVLANDEDAWRQAAVLSEWYQADGATPEWKELVRKATKQTESSDLLVALAQFGQAAELPFSILLQCRVDLESAPEAHAEWVRFNSGREQIPSLVGLLNHEDDWVQQAAIERLSALTEGEDLHWDISDPERLRQGMACVFARQDTPSVRQHLPEILSDIDETVRWIGLRWIGESGLVEHEGAVRKQLSRDDLTTRQFVAILATLELLSGKRGAEFENQQVASLSRMVTDPGTVSEAVRPLALRMLSTAVIRDRQKDLPPALQLTKLIELVGAEPLELSQECIRQLLLFYGADADVQQQLSQWAQDDRQPVELRVESISGMVDIDALMMLAADSRPEIQQAALRQLVGKTLSDTQRSQLRTLTQQMAADRNQEGVAMAMRLVGAIRDGRPEEDESTQPWLDWLDKAPKGNPVAGQRIFFSEVARCGSCHQISGRGGAVGPELTQVGRMDRARLLESILAPSREIAPRFTAWIVETDDGQSRMGLLQTERGGDQFYIDQNGEPFTANHETIVALDASERSLMPDDLLQSLTRQEIQDLLAYLSLLQ
jgi:putative membrane-bound dehydrogenase-like protein